ncbi:MAG: hypothetical protein R6U50_12365 [Desulfobacterales bacterium]
MSISRRLGIIIFCMVPAIVGGGIIYHFFQSYTPVVVWEILLIIFAIGFFSK